MSTAKPVFGTLAPIQAGSTSLEVAEYKAVLESAWKEIEKETKSTDVPVVVYTYSLSPFSSETIKLLKRLRVEFTEISLGMEWIPGLLVPGGAEKRAALLEKTGQSSLPHIFIGGKPIGGLYSGNPGLVPLLETDAFQTLVNDATKSLEFA
jgi:glutaredoxin